MTALGIEVEEEVIDTIALFRRVDVYYLEIGLVEAIWKILKLVPVEKLYCVKQGLQTIKTTYRLLEPPSRSLYRGYGDIP